jgi:hypothetical protein
MNMAKHKCPDCGAAHEMDAEGRIKRLEERVAELEARPLTCRHPHWWYTPTYYPTVITSGTSWQPDSGPVVVYNTSSTLTGGVS